jgi:uncharacterized protein YkwD
MVRISVIALAITALLASAPGMAVAKPTSRSAPACTGAYSVAVDEATRSRAADAMLCLINGERSKRGMSALRAATTLASAALGHSTEMVAGKFMSHSSRGGGGVKLRAIKAAYIPNATCSSLLGETIAFGAGSLATPARLVSSLMKDAAHRRTLLDRRFRDAGVGYALGAPMSGVGGSSATVTVDLGRR